MDHLAARCQTACRYRSGSAAANKNPPPPGVADDDWYPNLPAHAAEIDMAAWNALSFAADFDARIVEPGAHAKDVLAQRPYLTRMFTTISPAEMTEDPTFNPRPDLSEETVSSYHQANEHRYCCGLDTMTLPDDGRVRTFQTSALAPRSSSRSPERPWSSA